MFPHEKINLLCFADFLNARPYGHTPPHQLRSRHGHHQPLRPTHRDGIQHSHNDQQPSADLLKPLHKATQHLNAEDDLSDAEESEAVQVREDREEGLV
jgi:hypothetical protein